MNAPPHSGMQVGGNVVLKHQLSRGGMGDIWVGEHRGLEIDVAVKFLSPEFARDEGAAERFKREAGAAARVKSPHIVSVFDQGLTDDGLPFIVMELLEGEDLGKRVERLGPRPLSEVVTIVNQLARALGAAHAQGIVHRDIKPENVFLIDADGELFVKLLDFGVAKRVTDDALSVTRTGIMMGTPHFMSPEQVMSAKAVDAQADIWSLGAAVYVALTGRVPFHGETLGAVCYAIVAGEYVPITKIRRDLPPALDAWFERALHRDPASRFESVRQMAVALELAARVSPSRVHDPELPEGGRSVRAAPLLREGERGDAGASSSAPPHPTKFEATVGILPKVRRKRHVLATVASVLVALAFASVVAAALFLSPQQLEALKRTVSRASDKAPNTAVHSNMPEGVEPSLQAEETLQHEQRLPASPSRSAAAETRELPERRPTVVPRAAGGVREQASKPQAPTPDPSAWRAPRQEDAGPESAPERILEPPRPPSEDPYALPRPEPDSPSGGEDYPEEPEPRSDDEPDYGL